MYNGESLTGQRSGCRPFRVEFFKSRPLLLPDLLLLSPRTPNGTFHPATALLMPVSPRSYRGLLSLMPSKAPCCWNTRTRGIDGPNGVSGRGVSPLTGRNPNLVSAIRRRFPKPSSSRLPRSDSQAAWLFGAESGQVGMQAPDLEPPGELRGD